LLADAKAVEAAGAFAVVLECVPAKLAKLITQSISIPTIGIGAGSHCDGQVLVVNDMLDIMADRAPKFVKKFANIGDTMKAAFEEFCSEVQDGNFPSSEHEYDISHEIINKLK
jgi:3-methyl-2-oxobutanoate hydroxymethyltransferase